MLTALLAAAVCAWRVVHSCLLLQALLRGSCHAVSNGTHAYFFFMPMVAVSATDGKVLWANSFGGAVGPDAGYDLAFNPTSGELLASGAFSKNAVFGPGHAAAATVNNVMHSQVRWHSCMHRSRCPIHARVAVFTVLHSVKHLIAMEAFEACAYLGWEGMCWVKVMDISLLSWKWDFSTSLS